MEKIIVIEPHLAVGIYGKNNRNIDLLRNIYPTLKLTARGNELKVNGTDEEVATFESRFELLTAFYDHFERLTETDILNITANEDEHFFLLDKEQNGSDVILHGREGKVIKALTPNQKKLVKSLEHNDMIFAIGPAGTGKTYTAVALAVRALKNKQVKRIILTRPAVEAGENLGFLPGDMRDKLDPYLQPLYDALRDMMPMAKLVAYLEDKTIEIAPLAFMRGRTLDNAYVILDEAQNASSRCSLPVWAKTPSSSSPATSPRSTCPATSTPALCRPSTSCATSKASSSSSSTTRMWCATISSPKLSSGTKTGRRKRKETQRLNSFFLQNYYR